MRRIARAALVRGGAGCATAVAHADPVETLRGFVRDVKSGRAQFTQTVTSPDGAKKKTSTGSFEFSRPNRFRFAYAKPFEQTIVGDGEKVWIYDADLNQVSSRKLGAALGATPAALLAGGSLDKDFQLVQPSAEGRPGVGRSAAQGEGRRVPVGERRLQGQGPRGHRDPSTASARRRCCASTAFRPTRRSPPTPSASRPRRAPT